MGSQASWQFTAWKIANDGGLKDLVNSPSSMMINATLMVLWVRD